MVLSHKNKFTIISSKATFYARGKKLPIKNKSFKAIKIIIVVMKRNESISSSCDNRITNVWSRNLFEQSTVHRNNKVKPHLALSL